jgi:hypothetical protein
MKSSGATSFHPQRLMVMCQRLMASRKVAAKAGRRYTDLLVAHRDIVGRQVTDNLYERHLRPLFAPEGGKTA